MLCLSEVIAFHLPPELNSIDIYIWEDSLAQLRQHQTEEESAALPVLMGLCKRSIDFAIA